MKRSMPGLTVRPATRLVATLLVGVALGLASLASASPSPAAPTVEDRDRGVPAGAARDLDASIRLRANVRLAPGARVVRLRDIAWLDGATAARIGDLVVARRDDATDRRRMLTPRAVREAIISVGGHPARILVQGSAISLRSGTEDAEVRRPTAMTAIRLDARGRTLSGPAAHAALADTRPATRHVPATAVFRGEDVLAAITHRLVSRLGVTADDLRVGIIDEDVAWLSHSMHDMNLELLDDPRDASVRVRISPRARRGDVHGTAAGHIAVLRPELRVEQTRTTGVVERGDRFEPGLITIEHVWASPRIAALAVSRDDVLGMEADRRLGEGRVIGPQDVQRPLVVRRGDMLSVQAANARMQLRVRVTAREAGRVGDRISVEQQRTGQTFEVVVVAPGLAEPVNGSTATAHREAN